METVRVEMRAENELYFRLSHLISDGQSMRILMRYLEEGDYAAANEDRAQFRDFNARFNGICEQKSAQNLEFWSKILRQGNSSLFRDHHLANPQKSARCSKIVAKKGIIERLKHEKASPLALFLHLLGETLKYWQTNQDDDDEEVFVGIARDMRSSIEDMDFHRTIGFFTQTLPIPVRKRTIRELDDLLFEVAVLKNEEAFCVGKFLFVKKSFFL